MLPANQATGDLRNTERYFQSLIERGSDVVTILDRSGRVTYTSPSVTRILGYAPDELAGVEAMTLVHPGDVHVWATFEELVAAGDSAVRTASCRRRHKDGRWRHMEVTGTNLLNDEAVRGVVLNAKDVTDLREAELHIKRIVALSPAVLFVRGLESASPSRWVSDTIEDMLGYTPEEAERSGWWREHLHPDDRAQAVKTSESLEMEGVVCHEYRFRAKDGSFKWIRDHQRLVTDEDSQSIEVVGSWTDASEFKQLEAQFIHSQKMEAVGRLAGAIAHDFNNVLTCITGHVQLISSDLPGSDPMKADLAEMQQEIDRAASLTRQLLSFSRKQVARLEPIEVSAVIQSMQRMIERAVTERVTLSMRCSDTATWVMADRSQLEQVLLNLVVNASDAMHRNGGSLDIDVEPVTIPHGMVEVPAGEYVRLRVSDTGCGIPEDVLPRIFDPFFTTKEAGRGTGLGLATVHEIVEQAGGYVAVRSIVQRGTDFNIYLPTCGEPAHVGESSGPVADTASGTETILVVEDEDAVRKLACRILRRSGFFVIEAASGQEALLLANGGWGKVDLVLTDMVMPGVTGLEVAEATDRSWPGVPVIVSSGYPGETIDLGADHSRISFLEKPYSPIQLTAAVRNAIDGRKAAERAAA